MKPFKFPDPVRGTQRPDVQTQHEELPVRGLLAVKRDQVADLNHKLDEMGWAPDMSGATLGRQRPIAFSRIYGPIGLQAARRIPNAPGFLGNAPVVQPNTFILPTTTNILTGRNTTFFWVSTHVVSYLSWTYDAQLPGFPPVVPPLPPKPSPPWTPMPAGDLFAPVIEQNGGAQLLLNNSGFSFTSADSFTLGYDNPGLPKLCFELEFYDHRRGRLISDGRLPGEMFATGAYPPKELAAPVRVDPDTEIEPRVYVTECRMTRCLEQDDYYNAAQVACWINLVLRGYATTEISE